MGLLKSDLKISAGLLKEAAPKNHILAYITPSERDMLVKAGGVKTPTPSGIFAYPPGYGGGGYQGGSSNSSSSKGGGPAGGASAGGNYGGNSSGGVSANNMSGASNNNNNNNSGGDQEDDVATMETNMGVTTNNNPTGWSGDSGVDAFESSQDGLLGTPDYQGTVFTGGTFGTDDTQGSRTLSYGNDAATEDLGRPDITYYQPTGTKMGDYKSRTEFNQIKYIQDSKLQTVKNKLTKHGFDIDENANFQDTIDYVNNLSSEELPESYKDLKNPDGTPLYEPETLKQFEELGYIPTSGQHTIPGVIGRFFEKTDKPLTKDELLSSLDEAVEVGKSGGGDMNFQERMKTYQPKRYAAENGLLYNPRTKTFTKRESSGNEQDAFIRSNAAYEVGQTNPEESQAAKWYNNIGNNTQQFNFATAYANAKTKVSQTLNNKGAIGMLAVNDSPYYDWLKTKGLDKGIL